MILSSTFEVKMQRAIRNVLFLHAAKDETFLMLAMLSPGKDAVIHVDKNGKVLFQHIFPKPIQTMGMLSPREGIFLDTHNNIILLLDLQTHEFREVNHLFMFLQSDQSEIVTFPESRYLCIEEKGRYNKNRYNLTYYHYPIQRCHNHTARKVDVYSSQADQWTYEYTTRKGNNHSLIMWFKVRHIDSFDFRTYEIVGGKGEYKKYTFKRSIAGQGKIETVITNAWELSPQSYIFLCFSSKPTHNSNYVVEVNNKNHIRTSNFTFGPYQHQLIDCYSLGRYSMFRTFSFSHGKALTSPVFYVDNLTEKIVVQQQWKCSSSYKYEFQGYSGGVLCQGQYDNPDVREFKVTLKRVVDPIPFYEAILKKIQIKFQQDLIDDVIKMLI